MTTVEEGTAMSADRIESTRAALGIDDKFAGLVTEEVSKGVLSRWGVSTPRGTLVAPGSPVPQEFLDAVPEPFVLKYISSELVHKSDLGGVKLNVAREEVPAEVEALLTDERLAGMAPRGILIEQMVPSGVELVVGGYIDEAFGPVIMLGAGGIFVELFEDVTTRLCPVTEDDVHRMLDELKVSALLKGFRGAELAAIDAVVDVVLRLGGEDGLLVSLSDVPLELDINPLIVDSTTATAVDARIVIADAAEGNR